MMQLRGRISDMLHRMYEGQNCSIARALEIVGERWSLLILRDAFLGVRRFDDFQQRLGIGRNILTTRLRRLCDEGLLKRHRYQERPERLEYRLTDKGRDLWPVLVTLMNWGDSYYAPAGPPRIFAHRDCGGEVNDRQMCAACGAELNADQVQALPGPGAATRAASGRRAASH
jgi:DNA-binding HxlR family transcriptional regulator